MPMTEAELSYEDMKKAVDDGYLCAKCQGNLVLAWGGAYKVNGYILKCANEINHEGITRHDKKYEQKIKEGFSMESKELTTMNEAKMLQRVEMAKFPQDMTVADKKILAQVAITYGFDPLMGEVMIYQGRPFVSIDGRYRKAQETGRLDGVESRPATEQERKDWQIVDGDFFFRAEVFVKDAHHPFVGWGRVRISETKPGSSRQGDTTSTYKPIQGNPQRMAEKRAEAQALRKAFHIPLPSVEDIGSPDYDIESTARVVDTSTGEITEPQPEPEPEPKAPPPAVTPKTKPVKAEAKVIPPEEGKQPPKKTDPKALKNIEQMVKALKTDFGMSIQEMWNALGISSWNDLVIPPSEAYKVLSDSLTLVEQAESMGAKEIES